MDGRSENTANIYWSLTDRNKKLDSSKNIRVTDFHNWGVFNDNLRKSPTLKGLVQEVDQALPEGRDWTATFKKVNEELNLNFTKKEMGLTDKHKREKPHLRVCFVLKVDSTPEWAFEGFGSTKTEAIEDASIKGIKFYISTSSDKVIF